MTLRPLWYATLLSGIILSATAQQPRVVKYSIRIPTNDATVIRHQRLRARGLSDEQIADLEARKRAAIARHREAMTLDPAERARRAEIQIATQGYLGGRNGPRVYPKDTNRVKHGITNDILVHPLRHNRPETTP